MQSLCKSTSRNIKYDIKQTLSNTNTTIVNQINNIPKLIKDIIAPQDTVVIMSNGGFEDVDKKIIMELN